LAQPTINQARRLQHWRPPDLIFAAFALVYLGRAAFDALEGSLTIGAVLRGVFGLLFPTLLLWWLRRRWSDRGRRAEAAACRMAGRVPPAS